MRGGGGKAEGCLRPPSEFIAASSFKLRDLQHGCYNLYITAALSPVGWAFEAYENDSKAAVLTSS